MLVSESKPSVIPPLNQAIMHMTYMRNCDGILEILKKYLLNSASVFEVGTGSGFHGLYFAEKMENLVRWQPSDQMAHIEAVRENILKGRNENPSGHKVNDPISFDVAADEIQVGEFNALFTCKTMEIIHSNQNEYSILNFKLKVWGMR